MLGARQSIFLIKVNDSASHGPQGSLLVERVFKSGKPCNLSFFGFLLEPLLLGFLLLNLLLSLLDGLARGGLRIFFLGILSSWLTCLFGINGTSCSLFLFSLLLNLLFEALVAASFGQTSSLDFLDNLRSEDLLMPLVG